jgi:hypothetical protein
MSLARNSTHRVQRIALGLWGVAGLVLGLASNTARADAGDLCATLNSGAAHGGYSVLSSRELSHVQARPWNIVPEGVALLISAPEGTTAESLRLELAVCIRRADHRTANASIIEVSRQGSNYVVKLVAKKRSQALALMRAFD